jgi:1-acyl-sn-glycerol-3-phosphate acyltransferase
MNDGQVPERIKPINIREIFHDKNPRMASLLPGFIYKYLEKIIHQRDVNDFLKKHGDKFGLDFVRAAIDDFKVTITVRGEENIHREGRFIFACNHPLGGFDGMLMMEVMSRYYSDFRSLSNDILMNLINLHPLLLPINKHGRQDSDAAARLHSTYLSNTQIITFPAGLVSRFINGQVMDLEWKKNFISKAVQYQRDVVPVHFTGRNSDFFYRLYRLRKFMGIKANIEMLFLVDETYRHRNDHLTITFGPPIPYTTFDRSKTPMEWAKWVKGQVYALAGIRKVPL